ncbi:MAG TPA: tetratricopeptide repeat protein [Longimicrobium sp.]|nr:tetratricopeptide repeat protein [Longimicrobium sp.]
MSLSEVTVEQLLQLLPGLDELEVLRLRLIAAAVPDPERQWDSSLAYSTVDKRILTLEDVERSLRQSQEELEQYIALLHAGLRDVSRSFFSGNAEEAALHLVALGERHEAAGRARGARSCYDAALRLSLPLGDKRPQILALRRLGRVSLALADFAEATAYYERSAQLARDVEDVHAQIIARTGVGNVLMYQGRWLDAEAAYVATLELVEAAEGRMVLERGQLFNNLANLNYRLGRMPEAEGWLTRALEIWDAVSSPVDHAICLANLGHLRLQQARLDEARTAYEAALALPVPPSSKALTAADLAELCLLEGHVSEAEKLARVAEEHAIAAGSPYTLGYMYRNRGNLAKAHGAEDGFTFYEKALQIAREKGYASLEADTLLDYAELRRRTGGVEEAHAYLERARDLFRDLGEVESLARAEKAVKELSGELPVAAAAD